jgi:tetratricopeptide (TPR) repeat protein
MFDALFVGWPALVVEKPDRPVTFVVMNIRLPKLYPVVTAILLTVGNSLPAVGQSLAAPGDVPNESGAPSDIVAPDPSQSRIDAMLAELRAAPPAEATRLTREIERLWGQSGSTALDMLLRRGREAMKEQDLDVAIEHLTAVTDHAPGFAEGWHARATAYYMKGRYGPALDDLQKALILNPSNYNAIFGLGVMFQEFGDLRRAERAFEQVLALHPNHENATKAREQLKRDGIGREL